MLVVSSYYTYCWDGKEKENVIMLNETTVNGSALQLKITMEHIDHF